MLRQEQSVAIIDYPIYCVGYDAHVLSALSQPCTVYDPKVMMQKASPHSHIHRYFSIKDVEELPHPCVLVITLKNKMTARVLARHAKSLGIPVYAVYFPLESTLRLLNHATTGSLLCSAAIEKPTVASGFFEQALIKHMSASPLIKTAQEAYHHYSTLFHVASKAHADESRILHFMDKVLDTYGIEGVSEWSRDQFDLIVNAFVNESPLPLFSDPRLYIVGAGPGKVDLLTRQAYQLLKTASVLVADEQIDSSIIALSGKASVFRLPSDTLSEESVEAIVKALDKNQLVIRLVPGHGSIGLNRLSESMHSLFQVEPVFVPGVGK